MKGVILAGGSGTRLDPLTRALNKHLLPVYDKPMVCFPLECLTRSGIDDIVLISGPEHIAAFEQLLGDGAEFGARRLDFAVQERPGGIAHALAVAEPFACGGPVTVFLGDNILQYDIAPYVSAYGPRRGGAHILLKAVEDPRSFGIAEVDAEDRVLSLVEKPQQPASNLAVIGVYLYDARVFELVRTLQPSGRGELEITDLNRAYLDRGELTCSQVQGWWIDAGENFDQYLETCNRVARDGANHPHAA